MGGVITREDKAYIVLPEKRALLYAEFSGEESLKLKLDREFSVKKIASNGTKYRWYRDRRFKGTGQLLLAVAPELYRGRVDPDNVRPRKLGLERILFLGKSRDINTTDESITEVAQEIQGQLPKRYRDNPYALTEGIVHWIGDNIEYVIVPKYMIKSVEKTISELSGRDRFDVYKILERSFNMNDKLLKELADRIYLLPFLIKANDYEIAKELMNQVNSVWNIFQLFWDIGDRNSAKKTLEERSGKCVGMTNLFIALSRNLGIPSRKIGGYVEERCNRFSGGKHAWATSHLHPYGWVEADPTSGEFEQFDYHTHSYIFSDDHKHFPKFTTIERNNIVATDKIDSILRMLRNDDVWHAWLLRRKKINC